MLRRVLLELHSRTAVAEATDVVLETFEGYVDRVDGETAHVQLKSREYGDVLYGTYPTSQLSAKGIEEQSRFLCETVKVDGNYAHRLAGTPRRRADRRRASRIEERIDKAIPCDDPGIEY